MATIGLVAVALIVVLLGVSFRSFQESMDFIYQCDEPQSAQLNAALPLYAGATLVAKEACGGVGYSSAKLYFASADEEGTIRDWFRTAWADWAAASDGKWLARGLTVTAGFSPGGGGGTRISLAIVGDELPKPEKDVKRATVEKAPEDTRVYFVIEQEGSMW